MPVLVALNQVSFRRPGIGVDLDAEGRHREGMDDVGGGGLHAHDLVHGNHHFVIDGEQARLLVGWPSASRIRNGPLSG